MIYTPEDYSILTDRMSPEMNMEIAELIVEFLKRKRDDEEDDADEEPSDES